MEDNNIIFNNSRVVIRRLQKPFWAKCAVCGIVYPDHTGSTPCCGSIAYVTDENGIEIILKIMSEDNNSSLWIKTTERLPETAQQILFIIDRTIVAGSFSTVFQSFDSLTGNGYYWEYVSHWMPYPELPKE